MSEGVDVVGCCCGGCGSTRRDGCAVVPPAATRDASDAPSEVSTFSATSNDCRVCGILMVRRLSGTNPVLVGGREHGLPATENM